MRTTTTPDMDLYPVDEALLETLESEHTSNPARLAELTDYDRQYVQKRLKRLSEENYVERLGHGLYRFNESPA